MTNRTTVDLWGSGVRIPILMISGPVNSGKTLFALDIDPNCRRPRAEAEPTTLCYDQEGSAEPYQDGLNFEWKDTRAAVAAGVHMQRVPAQQSDPRWLRILKENADCNDSPAASMFRAWYLSLLKIEAGRYSVGICDTFTPLQDGMVDWLRRHPEAFGRTVNEYTKAASMFLWPDCKAMLSHILTVDCRLRFATFVITLHLKSEWVGGSKTANKIAEGLDVLEKLATVHIELDRSPKAKGKESPRVPSGILKKERLVVFGANPDDDRPVLPPRIPKCTPHEIRKYIASPPDFAALKADERAVDDSMTDEQRLLIQQEISRNEAEAATAKLSALELARQAAAQGRYESVTVSTESRPADVSGGNGNGNGQSAPAPTAPAQPATISPAKVQEIMGLMRELFASGAAASEWLMQEEAVPNPAMLTDLQADGVLSKLYAMKTAKNTPATPAPTPADPPTPNNGHATAEQRERIRGLMTARHGDQAPAEQGRWLQSLGLNSANSLTYHQAAARIVELEAQQEAAAVASAPFDDQEIPY